MSKRHLLTTWDGFANLRTRTDQVNASTETARYDALNRLIGNTSARSWSTSGRANGSYSYRVRSST